MRPISPGAYEGDYVVLDFEVTNNLFGNPSYDNHLVCAVWYVSWLDRYFFAETNYNLLAEHLMSTSMLVAHNAKYEWKWLRKLGYFLDGLEIFDTMLAQYTLDGVVRKPVNLDDLCTRYGLPNKDPVIDKLMKNGICPSQQPRSKLIKRCKRDVECTHELFLNLSLIHI